jgi:hypothetical protein
MIVRPTCIRHRSKKRDEAKAEQDAGRAETKADQEYRGPRVLGEDGDVEVIEEEKLEYPSRPHGSFDE